MIPLGEGYLRHNQEYRKSDKEDVNCDALDRRVQTD
jgi:hypothetical protein